ncbi:hypothetical protein SESBI_48924 [Sesbania bispinosa]|nr:hypothetical protein SESBI_48924 [Sesbania bispinosa]
MGKKPLEGRDAQGRTSKRAGAPLMLIILMPKATSDPTLGLTSKNSTKFPYL